MGAQNTLRSIAILSTTRFKRALFGLYTSIPITNSLTYSPKLLVLLVFII